MRRLCLHIYKTSYTSKGSPRANLRIVSFFGADYYVRKYLHSARGTVLFDSYIFFACGMCIRNTLKNIWQNFQHMY